MLTTFLIGMGVMVGGVALVVGVTFLVANLPGKEIEDGKHAKYNGPQTKFAASKPASTDRIGASETQE